MKRSFLIAALGGLVLMGPALAVTSAQATKPKAATAGETRMPLAQPAVDPPAAVPAGDLVLGTIKIPRPVTADGKPLPAGTYQVRLTAKEGESPAKGATKEYERYVEFVQGGQVKGREVASIVPAPDTAKVAKDKKPAPNSGKVELLKGNDYLRVWFNKGGNNVLIHLPVSNA